MRLGRAAAFPIISADRVDNGPAARGLRSSITRPPMGSAMCDLDGIARGAKVGATMTLAMLAT
jgi:hypothetical protein